MNASVKSGLLAGLIAAVIWMMISTAVDLGKTPVMVGGIVCLIGTWLVSAAISTMISRSRSRT